MWWNIPQLPLSGQSNGRHQPCPLVRSAPYIRLNQFKTTVILGLKVPKNSIGNQIGHLDQA
jgi:hypothetical protein